MKYWLDVQNKDYYCGDQVRPFHIEVPERPSESHEWIDNSWVLSEESQRKLFKESRQVKVSKIKVTTSSGYTFDGDETSQTRMTRVLIGMPDDETVTWVLADNTAVQVTKEELAEALYLAGHEQSKLWLPPEEV